MKKELKALVRCYPEIFFLRGSLLGTILFVITFVNPKVALAGVLSVGSAYGFARFLHMEREFMGSGFYSYNPLLVGLSLGYLFELTPLTIFFILSSGLVTFMLTITMESLFRTYLQLPVLSLPFVIVSSMAYLASFKYSNFMVAATSVSFSTVSDGSLPVWLSGYFKSFGAILFAPSVVVGLALSLLILRSSRILFLLSVLGYFVGGAVRTLMLGSAHQAFGDIMNFNFILIAMAVGGVFLVPSLSSYLIAMMAVVVSTVFLDSISVFWSLYGIPAFTLPFNVIALGVIYVLGLTKHPLVVRRMGATPEETLEYYIADGLRYRGAEHTLYLPFSGCWTVWQGFDGPWTHKGSWRHAYDFVITDDEGKTHTGRGDSLEDYYGYCKPILSPVRGRVVEVVDGLPDCFIGSVDRVNNWGNLVIIQDLRGFFAEISHMAANSIRVRIGDWVERDAVLGLCGNSGYSPQPHIHVQVQTTPAVGAASLPFSFVSYANGACCYANALPDVGQKVEPLYPDKDLDAVTNFLLDEQQQYRVLRQGKELDRLVLDVKMAADGSFFFDSGRGHLYFGKHEGTFYFYRLDGDDPWLRSFFLALPRMPLGYRDRLCWHDYVPVGLAVSGFQKMLAGSLASLYPSLAQVESHMTFAGRNRVKSCIESKTLGFRTTAEVLFDGQKGFASVKVGNLEFRRADREKTGGPLCPGR